MEGFASEDVADFYKKALVPAGSINAEDPYQNFFYYIQSLATPWNVPNEYQLRNMSGKDDGEGTRFILFYMATSVAGSSQGGIMYDQPQGWPSLELANSAQSRPTDWPSIGTSRPVLGRPVLNGLAASLYDTHDLPRVDNFRQDYFCELQIGGHQAWRSRASLPLEVPLVVCR
jgi:hypothetical protein